MVIPGADETAADVTAAAGVVGFTLVVQTDVVEVADPVQLSQEFDTLPEAPLTRVKGPSELGPKVKGDPSVKEDAVVVVLTLFGHCSAVADMADGLEIVRVFDSW